MAAYLLSTKALFEFVNGAYSPCDKFRAWCQGLSQSDRLFASEISLGELRTSVEAHSDLQLREDWRGYLDDEIPRQFSTRLLPFRGSAVSEWGLIRLTGDPPLPAEETMLIGQALANELILVGPQTASHRTIRIEMFDPYDGAGWPGETF